MRWNMRMKAAEAGIWKSTELRRMLADAGLEISAGKMSGLWTGHPTSIRLDDLDVICFVLGCTPAELLIYQDLQYADRGPAWKVVLDGTFDLDGALPVNPDGGLKSFGHPVGASGLRMVFEAWLQLRGEAPPERTIKHADRGLALTHNLGGYPGEMVSFVSIVGNQLG
jgi:acetyl-CoA acetyltransferase